MDHKKKILLTGVTKGLGKALLMELTGLGHTIIGCGRSESDIREISETLQAPHRFDALDVSCWDQVRFWAEKISDEAGSIDLIINNAGVINGNAPLWKISDEEFKGVMDVNVRGPANIIRAFLPAMIQAGRGIVANMSSGWGRSVAPEVAPYCASKWAIEGLTKALSQELPEGVATVAVNPGVINTNMLKSCWGHAAEDAITPEEWAGKAARFFLSLSSEDNGKSLSIR